MSDAAPVIRASDLTARQRAALGYLAGRPWGCSPKYPTTWNSLQSRGLVGMTSERPRSLVLTGVGEKVVELLDRTETAE